MTSEVIVKSGDRFELDPDYKPLPLPLPLRYVLNKLTNPISHLHYTLKMSPFSHCCLAYISLPCVALWRSRLLNIFGADW